MIIQEGVPTYERVNDAVAEPVVYMIDRYVVGGFYRVHAERGIDENLNAPGASFVPLAFAEQQPAAQARREAGRQRAEPLLHVRRDRPAGDGGGELRARSDRPRRRDLRVARPAASRRAQCGACCEAQSPPRPAATACAAAGQTRDPARSAVQPRRADARRHRRRLRRHRHQPAVRAEGSLRAAATCRSRRTTSSACCRWSSGR